MKNIFALCIILVIATTAISTEEVSEEKAECISKQCVTSTDCALGADDFSCRCIGLHCGKLPAGEKCGGGCLTNAQCAKWAGDDASCVCSWLLECENSADRERPGYETYTKFMAALQGDKLRQKYEALVKEARIAEEKEQQKA